MYIFQCIVVGLIVLVFGSAIINLCLMWWDLWYKIKINIQLPKPKRYSSKVAPIYQLEYSRWEEMMVIHKWDLDYVSNDNLQIFLPFVCFYPIIIKFWKYRLIDTVTVCDVDNVINLPDDLGKLYEDKWAITNEKWLNEERVRKEKRNKIDSLNKVFNENFEK
jgi:hypothetical protein